MNDTRIFEIPTRDKVFRMFALLGLASITISLCMGNFFSLGIIILLPIVLIAFLYILQYPSTLLFLIFVVNYFIIGINRYINIPAISIIMDSLLIGLLIILIIHGAIAQNIEWKYANNILTWVSFVWMIYCIIEIVNPTGLLKAWFLSRGLIFNGLIITLITTLTITRSKQLHALLILYSVFTLVAALKAIGQRFIGFDNFELRWLHEGGALTHLIMSGTRYFSFFSDAGNFGSNMGCAGIAFGIITFFTPKKKLKVYYSMVSIFAFSGMFLSGTRGAMIVPLGGLALYTLISKNFKAMIAGGIILSIIYAFFAFTYIGQSNAYIRRMRTSFTPNKDASFNVRKNNQKKLASYLKNKPFGEGLGLSGVENRKVSLRFTTTIPHDSLYVKIWVETGIVGLILYLGGFIIVIAKCAQIIMFKIKNIELRGIFTGLLCGIFGMLLSAYGNAFFGQYPTAIIVYVFLSLILKGEYFDKLLTLQKNNL